MAAALLRLVRVTKEYAPAGGGPPAAVLRDISLEIRRGESVAVTGPSGSGKSTLLNLIGTLDQPTRGEVWHEERLISGLDGRELAVVRNQRLGFVFQSHHLLPQCSVWENVLLPALAGHCPGGSSERVEVRAERLLKRVGLLDRRDHRPGQLSGGERQRVAVARALVNQPALLLADEPTGALDQACARELCRLLVELNEEENVTLVVVTHSLELAAAMSRRLELLNGRLAGQPPV